MVASYLLDPGSGGHNLERLSRTHLGHDPITYEETVGDKKTGFQDITPEAAFEYACEDADLAMRLVDELRPKLEEGGLLELYEDMELPLIDWSLAEVTAKCEMKRSWALRSTCEILRDLSKELAQGMERAEARDVRPGRPGVQYQFRPSSLGRYFSRN